MEQAQASETFLSSRQVKDRYGHVSEMWLYRREHEQGGDFPKPVRIRGRRFWRLSDLVAYERALARGTTTTTRNAKLEGDDAQVEV